MSEPWPAPAKINRFLHIVGRRDDGYHRLQTVFQFLDFCDELELSVRADGQVRRVGELSEGIAESDDLSVRAARSLQRASGTGLGADIRIRKRIPVGAGLGGGSSDAATALVGLNRLWRTGLGEEQLAALGLELGADVPVFVRGQAAWAEGVGEQLTPLKLDEPWYLVLVPAVCVSTAAVFSDPELTRDSPPMTISDFLSGRVMGNDCEPVVARRYAEVAAALRALGRLGQARLTGTGACVYCAFERRDQAQRALESLAPDWRGFIAQGRNRSPLLARLDREPSA